MAKVSIIDWIVKKLKRCIAIVEDGDTASQAIASGKYVIWKGNAYKASSAISQGDTLSLSNLTAVSDGIGNELNSKIQYIADGADLSNCSTLLEVRTAIVNNPARCGHAQTGASDSCNFKTLVGNSGLSANDQTFVMQIAPNTFMCVATSLVVSTGVKMKFIRFAGWAPNDASRASQTQWMNFAVQS